MNYKKIQSFLVQQSVSIKKAMFEMTENGIKILFIVDNNKNLIGTLTDGDIRRAITSGIEISEQISKIMHTDFISLSATDPAARKKAITMMKKHQIEYVPLLSSGKVVDIYTWYELIEPQSEAKPIKIIDNLVVIMAGGKGTRMDPFTRILPKPLIPLGEKTVLEVIMDRFYNSGFINFKIIVNHKKEMIKLYLKEHNYPYSIEIVEEADYLGTVGGLSLLKEKIDKPFILTNCDTLLEGDYCDFLTWHADTGNIMTIIGSHREFDVPYGVLNMNDGLFVEMIEKPKYDLFINTGSYIMEPKIFDFIPQNQKMDADELIINIKKESPASIGVFPCWGDWCDVGQWEEYKKTLALFGLSDPFLPTHG